jgi:hypothetical protein
MSRKDTDIARHGRRDRFIKEQVHDPYMAREKLPEPTACPECRAVYQDGRWEWPSTAIEAGPAHEQLCPACQRVRDHMPAGYLNLAGEFFKAHRGEILNLVHNKVRTEESEHPMKRLMNVEDNEDGVVVTFTDTHLPRGAGTAIKNAYDGELDIHYSDDASIVRAYWTR